MAEEPEDETREIEETAPQRPPLWRRALSAGGWFFARFGLFLFMILVPLLLAAYPAWKLSAHLLDYAQARTVEAELGAIDIRMVELGQDQTSLFEARKHYDVMFHFKGGKGEKYVAMVEMPWPAPGLKRRLSNQYLIGEPYTLYLLPSQVIAIDEMVATDSFYRLTALMGLILLGSILFLMLWKRLAHRMPSAMPRFPDATQKSLVYGQLITLLLTGLLAVIITYRPMPVAIWVFIAVYWGLTAFLALSLRLLMFEGPAPAPAPAAEEEPRRAS